MSPSHPTQLQLATLVATVNLAALEQAIRDAQPGQPGATNYDPRTTSGQGPADPTASAALAPSPAVGHLAEFIRARDLAYASYLTLAGLSERYTPAHEPRRSTIIADTKGCTWHDQAGIEAHHPVWRTSDCGFLAKPVALCRACYDYAHTHGARPTNEQIHLKERRGRWFERVNPKKRHFTAEQVADFKPGGTAA